MRIFNFTQIGIIKQRTGPRGAAAIKQISPSLISGVQTLVISAWMPGVIQPQQMENLQHSNAVEILKLENVCPKLGSYLEVALN